MPHFPGSRLRALLSAPPAPLPDAPFSRLDAALRKDFRSFVLDHARQQEMPTLPVTPDPDDAANAGGPIIDLAQGCR